ncbi:MAG: hypothetical protein ACRBG0_19090, partial [Lewinella sp.]|uniref:hypothetical protein n=1 Tax=Lewinella sp. TaxID=2004506 RepID=UPI003D6A6C7F
MNMITLKHQCPLQGGNAVHRARTMLRGIGEYNFQGVNCVSAQALQGDNSNDSPATDRKLSDVDDEATDP